MFLSNPNKNKIYYVNIDSYLDPKKYSRTSKLLQFEENVRPLKQNLRIKLLEHPVLSDEKNHKSQRSWKETQRTYGDEGLETNGQQDKSESFKNLKSLELPNWLGFLNGGNDDEGTQRKKNGFEIFCEMTSFHGFCNFIGATSWQKFFWLGVISFAIVMSTSIAVTSFTMNKESPFTISTESTTYGTWSIPFPAVTICDLNRISKMKVSQFTSIMRNKINLTYNDMENLFRLASFNLDQVTFNRSDQISYENALTILNNTLAKFLESLSPDCEKQIVRCKWKGRIEKCDKWFQVVSTPNGLCCSFNLLMKLPRNSHHPFYSFSCGFQNGLTILIEPNVSDCTASMTKAVGYQVLIHDAFDYPSAGSERYFIPIRTEAKIDINAVQTASSTFVKAERVKKRRCYYPGERKLHFFPSYSIMNCLAECRSQKFFDKCGCVPLNMPRAANWPQCEPNQLPCTLQYKDFLSETISNDVKAYIYKNNRNAEQYACNCYPSCSFNQYRATMDYGLLDRNFSVSDKRLFKGIDLKDHILLHVFYGDTAAHKLRMDVSENWLSFIGTFGGIIGLFMGCSFVTVLEIFYFGFVRPTSNWLNRKILLHPDDTDNGNEKSQTEVLKNREGLENNQT